MKYYNEEEPLNLTEDHMKFVADRKIKPPMTDKEVMGKVIEIALENGWCPFAIEKFYVLEIETKVVFKLVYFNYLIFNLQFAKALFGSVPEANVLTNWQWNLQQLAISENRIEYLRRWLNEKVK